MIQKYTFKKWKSDKGLTLLELLVTIAVLAIVAAIAVPVVTNVVNSTDDRALAQTQSDITDFVDKYNKSGSYTYDPNTGVFSGYVDLNGDGAATNDEKMEELDIDTDRFNITTTGDNAPSDATVANFYDTTPNTTFTVEGASGGAVAEPARVVLTSSSPEWAVLGNGVTITCDSANTGDSATFSIDGVETTMVKRTAGEIAANNSLAATSCTSGVTDMGEDLFKGVYGFNPDISTWDTSSVTNMSYMFRYVYDFNQDISNWDVSSVRNMHSMFRFNFEFNQDISNWDVSSVTRMEYMFASAETFNQDLSGWDVSSVLAGTYRFDDGANSWTLPKPNFP